MPRFSARERRELAEWACVQRAAGRTYTEIAEEACVDRHTVKGWIESEFVVRSEYRFVSNERERGIALYEALIREGWQRLERLDDNSTNAPGLINAIRQTQSRIDKLTGAEAPIKYREVEDEIVIEWEDLDTPVDPAE